MSEQRAGARGRARAGTAVDADLTDARATWAVIEATRDQARDALEVREGPVYVAWGLAWFVAFGVTFLAAEGAAPLAWLPAPVLALLWPVCLGGAFAFDLAHRRRFTRGRSGRTAELGRRCGLAYGAAFVLAVGLLFMLGVLPPEPPVGAEPVAMWEISMIFVFALAVIYLAEGAHLRDNVLLAGGLWLGGLNAAAALLAPAWYGAVMAVLGGGGFLALGFVARRRRAGSVR